MSNAASHNRSHELRGLWVHAAIFVAVNLMLIVINLKKTPEYFWEKWVLLNWGAGLLTHAWLVVRPPTHNR